MLDSDLSALIADIYSGGRDRRLWDKTMTAIADRFNAQFLMVATADRKRSNLADMRFFNVRHERFDDAIAQYADETYKIDPTIKHAIRNPYGGTFDSVKEIGVTEYGDHPYVRWNVATSGSMFWTTFHRADRGELSFGLSLHRSQASGPLSDNDTALFSLLFDHVRNAFTLAAYPPLIESDEATLLLDSSGYVIASNEVSRTIINTHNALHIINGRLRATDPRSRVMLDHALRRVLDLTSAQEAISLQNASGAPLLCDVRALPDANISHLSLGRTRVSVRLVDPVTRPQRRSQSWRTLFGLTAAEMRLAASLIETDGNLRDVANTLGVTHGTARVQLASIFEKAAVTSQAQLVRLLTRLR